MKCIYVLAILPFLSQIAISQAYYPLSVSNQWFYDSSAVGNHVKVVSDSLFPNGRHYAVLNKWDFVYGQYVRVDSHYVYYYMPTDSHEVAVFKLDGKKGDTTVANFNAFYHVIITGVDTTTILKEKTRIISYRLDGLQLREITISEKFGLVSASLYSDPPPPWPDYIYNIVGCTIDGKTFGYVSSITQAKITPNEFVLSQNYPNPFNPTTTIDFSLVKEDYVRLTIFDNLGRVISRLVAEKLWAGEHRRTWNPENNASGIYYYRLETGNTSLTKKLVLLR